MDHVGKLPIVSLADAPLPADVKRRAGREYLKRLMCTIFASLGVFGGLCLAFAGLVCVVVHSASRGDSVFDEVGTALLCAAIPAMFIGSILMDELDQ